MSMSSSVSSVNSDAAKNTVNEAEVNKFRQMSETWLELFSQKIFFVKFVYPLYFVT